MNLFAFKMLVKTKRVFGRRRYAIVAHNRLGKDKDLSVIRGVRHGFRISHHRSGENYFAAIDVSFVGSKGSCFEFFA